MAEKNNVVVVKHEASGAEAQVNLFGATVTSFKSADGKEHLFVSKDALYNGKKAIRGGIPVSLWRG